MSKRKVTTGASSARNSAVSAAAERRLPAQKLGRSIMLNGVRLALFKGQVWASLPDLFRLAGYWSVNGPHRHWQNIPDTIYATRGLDWRDDAVKFAQVGSNPSWFMSVDGVERLCTILPDERAARIRSWIEANRFDYETARAEEDARIGEHVASVSVLRVEIEGEAAYRVDDVLHVMASNRVVEGSASKFLSRLLGGQRGTDTPGFLRARVYRGLALYVTADGLRSLLHTGKMSDAWRLALRLWMEREGIATDPQPEQSGEPATSAAITPASMPAEPPPAATAPAPAAAEASEAEARELIAQAKAEGKLPPQLEPVWMDIGRADPATLRRLVNSTPAPTAPQSAAPPSAAAPANPGTAQPCARRAALAQERAHDLHALAAGTLGQMATHLLELRSLVKLLQHGAVEVERNAPGSIEWAGVFSLLGQLIPDGFAMDDQIEAVVTTARHGLTAVAEGDEGDEAERGGAPVQKAFASDRAAIAAAAGISRADAQGAGA